jgi:hypothetical protein
MVRSRKTIYTLDLSDYDPDGGDFSGGGVVVIPPGEYPMKCESVEKKISKNDNEQFEWTFIGTGGKAKGKKFYLYTLLDQHQKLGKTLVALGIEIEPGKEIKFDPDDAIDAECIGEVITDTYNNEKRSKLQRIMPATASAPVEEEEEEEETPKRRRRSRGDNGRSAVKLSEDEVKELTEEELEELTEKHELEVDLAKFKTMTKKKNAVIEALTEKNLIA